MLEVELDPLAICRLAGETLPSGLDTVVSAAETVIAEPEVFVTAVPEPFTSSISAKKLPVGPRGEAVQVTVAVSWFEQDSVPPLWVTDVKASPANTSDDTVSVKLWLAVLTEFVAVIVKV